MEPVLHARHLADRKGEVVGLSVAAAQPLTILGELAANVERHAAMVLTCATRLVVFPELSLTGYDFHAPAVAVDDPLLAPLVDACRTVGATALVGAPVAVEGRRAIGVLAIHDSRVDIVYRKMSLGGAENDHFVAGSAAAVIDVDGWRVGVGVCKDTRIATHLDATARLGLDLYVAGLVHLPQDLPELAERARRIATAHAVPVALAGFAGATGEGFDATSGGSGSWHHDGTLIQQAGPLPNEYVRTVLLES